MKRKILTTDRLLLRPFEPSDIDDVFEYAQDPEWGRFLPVPRPYEYKHAIEFVKQSVNSSWKTNPVFAVSRNRKVIGAINLEIEAVNRSAEVGYSISRAYWGKGLVVEAVQVVLDWVLEEFNLTSVSALVDVANTRSIRVLENLGMRQETKFPCEQVNIDEHTTRGGEVRFVLSREDSQ